MGIKTIAHPPYSLDVASCDFWLFPKLRGCRYETIEEKKEAVTKVVDTLTQEDFHGAFQKSLERYKKCIAAGGDYFEGDLIFMCVLSIKVPIRKRLETYLMILVIHISCYHTRIPLRTPPLQKKQKQKNKKPKNKTKTNKQIAYKMYCRLILYIRFKFCSS